MTTQVLHGSTQDAPPSFPSRRDPGRGGRSRPRTGATPAARPATVQAGLQTGLQTTAQTTTQTTRSTAPSPSKTAPKTRPTTRSGSADGPRRTPNRWAGIGVGLTVAVATTTTLTATAPQAAAPEVDDRPTTGTLRAVTQAATALEARDDAASRSGVRTAPAEQATTGSQVSVPAETTLSVETVGEGRIAPAPEPVLPGCDGEIAGLGTNGQVPASELCTLWDGRTKVRADAAVALAQLNEAYIATWGEPLCITDGYRTYGDQVAVKAAKPTLAATPGTSNHGWGLAVDICAESYAGSRWDWLAAFGPTYGWDNPAWARTGGAG
ncbi:M15 family metallopeptidase, partial [Isoptericola sp. NEAU-Y5]